jgi:penicillin-binding protein 2
MSRLSKYIPIMFHRRVLLLGVLVLGVFVFLVARLGWMTLTENGAQSRAIAARQLVVETWLPTVRGTIFDRKGRVLARDQASYDIAVHYRVLEGRWVYRGSGGKLHDISMRGMARRLAARANPDLWDTLEASEQDEISGAFERALRDRVDAMYREISRQTEVELDEILARRDQILARVRAMKESHRVRKRATEYQKYKDRGVTPSAGDRERIEEMADKPIVEETHAHTLVGDVSDKIGFSLIRQSRINTPIVRLPEGTDERIIERTSVAVLPGVSVIYATVRIYPFTDTDIDVPVDRSSFPLAMRADEVVTLDEHDIGSLILGSLRKGIQADDRPRRARALLDDPALRDRVTTKRGTDRGRYMNDDRVGRTGLERSYEDHLRGLRGYTIENKQTGERQETPSTPGLDVNLTIDIMLQARIRALIDPRLGLARIQSWQGNTKPETMTPGTELGAGAVVLEVATGEILSLVSGPVAPGDGDWERLGITNDAQRRYFEQVHHPYINKAIAKPYPPGSVAKALILTGAAAYGKYSPHEQIKATGHLYPDRPDILRSWIFKQYKMTHAEQLGREPDGVDALMVSSNVFFFTLGERLGPIEIAEVYRRFGVGHRYELGVGTVWPGSIGALDSNNDGSDLTINDAIQLGIGQGPVTWTPLHAADAYATIARMGYHIEPSLIRTGVAPVVSNIWLDSWAAVEALDGLYAVVNDTRDGTGQHITFENIRDPVFNAPGIDVWGKTGTATTGPLLFDPDDLGAEGNGPIEPRIVRDGDHAWYVTLVGPKGEAPRFAIAVVVDYGGSGAKVAGPINNQIIHALIAEGYLPDVEGSP